MLTYVWPLTLGPLLIVSCTSIRNFSESPIIMGTCPFHGAVIADVFGWLKLSVAWCWLYCAGWVAVEIARHYAVY